MSCGDLTTDEALPSVRCVRERHSRETRLYRRLDRGEYLTACQVTLVKCSTGLPDARQPKMVNFGGDTRKVHASFPSPGQMRH